MRTFYAIILAATVAACASPPQLSIIPRVSVPQHCQDAAAKYIRLLRKEGVNTERIELLLVSPTGMQQQRPFAGEQSGHVAVVVDGVAVYDNGALRWCRTGGLEIPLADARSDQANRIHPSNVRRCILDEAIHGISAEHWTLKSLSAIEATGGLIADPWSGDSVADTR